MARDKHAIYMEMALVLSKLSTCVRRNVGCIIVDQNSHILATGYNGVPRGHSHCTDSPCGGAGYASGLSLNLCEAIHAEQNALIQCKDSMAVHTIYTTTFPCEHCLKMIANTGCKRVFYSSDYPTPLKLSAYNIEFTKI